MKNRLRIYTQYILMEVQRQRRFTCKEDQNFAFLIWFINTIWYSLSGIELLEFNFPQININRLNSLAFYNSTKYSMNLISLQRCEESLFWKLYLTPWLRCSRLNTSLRSRFPLHLLSPQQKQISLFTHTCVPHTYVNKCALTST